MRILFLCKGNICRSPTAEAYLQGRRPWWYVRSAATTNNTKGIGTYRPMVESAYKEGIFIDPKRSVISVDDIDEEFHEIHDLDAELISDPYITRNFQMTISQIKQYVDRLITRIEGTA